VLGRDSGSGFVVQNGGTFSFNPGNVGYLFIGASSSAATRAEYDMNGGTLDLNNYTLAVALSANSATLITGLVSQVSGNINNVGELDLGAFTFGPGHGIYSLTGGSIYLGSGGIVSDSGIYELDLGGGTVGAYASWSSPLNMNLTGSNGPVTFDTAGNTITLSGILSGNGGLTVVGGGTLELSGANTYAGDTTVSVGLLQLDATGSSAGAIRVANGALLNLNYSGNFVVGRFFTNGVALPNGIYNSANFPSFIVGSGNLQVIGAISRGHWTGLGANNNWSTAGNWDNGVEPIFPIDLTFAGSTRLNNVNDLAGISANSLTFDAAAGPFVLNGSSLGLNGNIMFSGNPAAPVTETINLPLVPAVNINVDTPPNGDLVINGGINAANNTVYKVDGGTMTLTGTNLFAGYDVDGGTNIITGNTTIAGTGGTRTYVANADYVGGSVGTLIISNGATFTITGNFADAYVVGRDGGAGKLIQNGGTFIFNPGNQTYLFLAAGDSPTTRGEYDMNGGLLDMNGKTLGFGLGVNVLVTGIMNQASGVITNVGQIFLDSFFSTGYSIYNLTGGSLYLGSGGITVQSGGSYELNFGGGIIAAQATWSSALNMMLTGINGPTTFNPAGNTITLSGALSGPGGLTVTGGGILELSGDNTYTGDTIVNPGSTLRLDSAGTTAGTFRVANGGALNLNYIGTYTVGNLYTNGVALANGTYNSANLAGVVSGTGSIQVVGATPAEGPTIGFSAGNGKITLTWPVGYESWVLQMQTNSLSTGLRGNWVDVAGSGGVTSTNITINPAIPTTFFRLRPPTP
jgi:autotransporter-associated beta strand protein